MEEKVSEQEDDTLSLESLPRPKESNNAIKQLEAEMKLLKWHKLANESAIQAALLRTKNLKKMDQFKKEDEDRQERKERKMRIQKIIEEERSKPLKLKTGKPANDCTKIEKINNSRERMLERRQIQLKQLKSKMDERQIRKVRKEHCNKVRSELNQQKRKLVHLKSDVLKKKSNTEGTRDTTDSSIKSPLHTVLRNLDHLASLERTIKSGTYAPLLPRLYSCDKAPKITREMASTKSTDSQSKSNVGKRSIILKNRSKRAIKDELPDIVKTPLSSSFVTQSCQINMYNKQPTHRRGSYLAPTRGGVSRKQNKMSQSSFLRSNQSIKPKSGNKYLNELHVIKNNYRKRTDSVRQQVSKKTLSTQKSTNQAHLRKNVKLAVKRSNANNLTASTRLYNSLKSVTLATGKEVPPTKPQSTYELPKVNKIWKRNSSNYGRHKSYKV